MAPPLAVKAAPGHGATRALTIMAAITSLASILGMPLGTMIGQQLGWRAAFGLVGVLSFAIGLGQLKFLPPVPGDRSKAGEKKLWPWRNPALLKIYLFTALTVTGHFTAFTYMSPLLAHSGGYGPRAIAWLLLTLGAAGIGGNILVSRFFDRRPRGCLALSLAGLTVSLAVFQAATRLPLGAVALCLAWGASMSAATLMYQTTVIKEARGSQDLANSLYSAIFNVGIGCGALAGNRLFSQLGLGSVNYGAAALVLPAALAAAAVMFRGRAKQVQL